MILEIILLRQRRYRTKPRVRRRRTLGKNAKHQPTLKGLQTLFCNAFSVLENLVILTQGIPKKRRDTLGYGL